MKMKTSSLVLICVLLTCSVWMVQGRNVKTSSDDQEQEEVEAGKRPGTCSACKWAVKQVRKEVGRDESEERVSSKLKAVCKKGGRLKKICEKFVMSHLDELVEELMTTDDVNTICVNVEACKEKPSTTSDGGGLFWKQ